MDATYTGTKIAVLRKEKGWTQKDLAAQLHVTDKAVSKWERGLNYPDISLLEPLCAQLGITLMELLGVEQVPMEAAIEKVTEISKTENLKLKRELRRRGWIIILFSLIIGATQIAASFLFDQQGMYGLPQVLTSGALGFTGILMGNGIYILLHYKEV